MQTELVSLGLIKASVISKILFTFFRQKNKVFYNKTVYYSKEKRLLVTESNTTAGFIFTSNSFNTQCLHKTNL